MTYTASFVDESLPPAQRVQQLLNGPIVAELHALAWLKPFRNSADSNQWDPGWSCRDHAVVLAALLTAAGVEAHIVHGANIFVQGPTTDGQPATGLGNVPGEKGTHTWIHTPAYGTLDISPRLDQRSDTWRPLPVNGLTGTTWPIPGYASQIATVDNAGDYEHNLNIAGHILDVASAIYWPHRITPFHPDMLDPHNIDSPLAHQLRDAAGEECYSNSLPTSGRSPAATADPWPASLNAKHGATSTK